MVSPGLTYQATSSTSAMPSPMSGILIARSDISAFHHAFERGADARRARKVVPLLRVRIRRGPAGDTFDRRLEVIEAVLLYQRQQLCTEAAGARGLVHDH